MLINVLYYCLLFFIYGKKKEVMRMVHDKVCATALIILLRFTDQCFKFSTELLK